jgi:hypothetical protein
MTPICSAAAKTEAIVNVTIHKIWRVPCEETGPLSLPLVPPWQSRLTSGGSWAAGGQESLPVERMKTRVRRGRSELGSAAQLLAIDRPDKRRHGGSLCIVMYPHGKSADSSVAEA